MATHKDELINYIKSMYDGKIIIDDTGSVLKLLAVDKRIAILYNYYQHNLTTEFKPEDEDEDEDEDEEISLDLIFGITTVININEVNWLNKQNICKSLIASAFDVYDNTYNAKDCVVKAVSIDDAKQFLETNHIDGNIETTDRYGLYYNDELVQLICVNKFKSTNDAELCRMCTKLHTLVIGGFSKLIMYADDPVLR